MVEGSYLGHLVIVHDIFHQYVEFFFEQFESGLACDCSNQLSTMNMMVGLFQVKGPLKRLEA